jgi:pimeloyl-ACP methyl ester carboxylesterase
VADTQDHARAFAPFLPYALRTSVGRTLFLSQQFGRPWRLTADEAIEAARTMGATKGFDEHLRSTNRARFSGGQDIDVPVTVAFGTRERLLSKSGGRRRDELPAHTRCLELRGCGHVPTWDDPARVAGVILETTALTDAVESTPGKRSVKRERPEETAGMSIS